MLGSLLWDQYLQQELVPPRAVDHATNTNYTAFQHVEDEVVFNNQNSIALFLEPAVFGDNTEKREIYQAHDAPIEQVEHSRRSVDTFRTDVIKDVLEIAVRLGIVEESIGLCHERVAGV